MGPASGRSIAKRGTNTSIQLVLELTEPIFIRRREDQAGLPLQRIVAARQDPVPGSMDLCRIDQLAECIEPPREATQPLIRQCISQSMAFRSPPLAR